MIRWTLTQDGPCAIRYAKNGKVDPACHPEREPDGFRHWTQIRPGTDLTLLAVGSMLKTALEAARILEMGKISAEVVRASLLKPADRKYLSRRNTRIPLVTVEEHMRTGGFGEYLTGLCREEGFAVPDMCLGVPDQYIQHGSHERLAKDAGLSPEQIAERVKRLIGRKED